MLAIMSNPPTACTSADFDKGHDMGTLMVHMPVFHLKKPGDLGTITIPPDTIAAAVGCADPDLINVDSITTTTYPAGNAYTISYAAADQTGSQRAAGLMLDRHEVVSNTSGGGYACSHVALADHSRTSTANVVHPTFESSSHRNDFNKVQTLLIKKRALPQYRKMKRANVTTGAKIIDDPATGSDPANQRVRIPAKGPAGQNLVHKFCDQNKDDMYEGFKRIETEDGPIFIAPKPVYDEVVQGICDIVTPRTAIGRHGLTINTTLVNKLKTPTGACPTHIPIEIKLHRTSPWVGNGYKAPVRVMPTKVTMTDVHPDMESAILEEPVSSDDLGAQYGFPGKSLSELRIRDADDVTDTTPLQEDRSLQFAPEPTYGDDEEEEVDIDDPAY